MTATPADLASPRRPLIAAAPRARPPAAQTQAPAAPTSGIDALLAALARLDGMNTSGLDGYDLNEIGIKNGNIVVDDRQSGNHWSFENITLSVRRPSGGGIALSVGEENTTRPWSFRAAVGPQVNGVRIVDISADKVLIKDLLFALRLKDASYTADLPITGRLRGEIGRDGLPTYFTGKLGVDAGSIIDRRAPEYPMNIDRADISVDWDSTRRVLVAPFQVVVGPEPHHAARASRAAERQRSELAARPLRRHDRAARHRRRNAADLQPHRRAHALRYRGPAHRC